MHVIREDIEAEIDATHLLAALDDNKDGAEDEGLFDALAASVDNRIDGLVARIVQRGHPTPPESFLRVVAAAAMCALLFRRRGVAEASNPFAEKEQEALSQLRGMASGKISTRGGYAGFVITMTKENDFLTPPDEAMLTSDSSDVSFSEEGEG